MRKNYLFLMIAACMSVFSSCSNDELVSQPNDNQVVTVMAQMPTDYANSRASMAIPGHDLRFTLEVQKSDGTLLGEEYRIVKIAEAGASSVQFTFPKPSEVNSKCVLWADYVTTGSTTDTYYNTTDFSAIALTETNTVFNNPAVDAFCGSQAIGSTTTLSMTLKRPFAKYTVKDSNPALLGDVSALGITATVPDGFNIATGEVGSTKPVTFSGTQAASSTELLYGFYFIDTTTSTNALPKLTVTFTVGDKTGTATLTPNENNADSNYGYSSTGDILGQATEDADLTLDVDIDNGFTDPNAPAEAKIGDYLFADGTWGSDPSKGTPVAVVFAVGAGEGDDVANYDGKLEKINGYAVSLGNSPNARQKFYEGTNSIALVGDNSTTAFNGQKNTATILDSDDYKADSENFLAIKNFLNYGTSAPASTSGWYIPSCAQMLDVLAKYGYQPKDGVAAANVVFKAAIDAQEGANKFVNGIPQYIWSSSTNSVGDKGWAILVTIVDDVYIYELKSVELSNSGYTRPVVTF